MKYYNSGKGLVLTPRNQQLQPETRYLWLMRTFITPVKLQKFNNTPDTCTKCNDAEGTLDLFVWQCLKVN